MVSDPKAAGFEEITNAADFDGATSKGHVIVFLGKAGCGRSVQGAKQLKEWADNTDDTEIQRFYVECGANNGLCWNKGMSEVSLFPAMGEYVDGKRDVLFDDMWNFVSSMAPPYDGPALKGWYLFNNGDPNALFVKDMWSWGHPDEEMKVVECSKNLGMCEAGCPGCQFPARGFFEDDGKMNPKTKLQGIMELLTYGM